MTDVVAGNPYNRLKTALFLGALISIIYGNTLNASWQFDDLPNITRNEKLHISDLRPLTLYQTLFASPAQSDTQDEELFRPVAMLTLSLNWYADRDKIKGYHVVNIGIHFLTAWMLYATILRILAAPNLEGRYHGLENSIALLSAVLWAANPIQTQAVTYIVQRMASLAALFFVGGVYFYLAGRQHQKRNYQWVCWGGTGLCFLLSMGSKENGVVLPMALILVEYLFFQDSGKAEVRRKLLLLSVIAISLAIAAGLALLVAFRSDFIVYLQDLYSQRSFTAVQRLLTQPRVLLLYLGLLFLPFPGRLSLIHEIEISFSLLKPWTTLPSILAILAMIWASLWWARRCPLVAFSLLFFFLNHAIEASFLPLEMVFEHRNYLPSLFLFVPVAVLLVNWTHKLNRHRRAASIAAGILVAVIVFALGMGTWARNKVWASPETLWRDVFAKSPNSARAYQNIAGQFAEQKHYREALAFYQRSLELKDPVPQRSKALALTNMANIYIELHNYPAAVRLLQNVLNTDPENILAHFNLIRPLTELGRIEDALAVVTALLGYDPVNPEYLNAKGFLLYRKGNFSDALSFFKAALSRNRAHLNATINLGMTLSRMGFYEQADQVLVPLTHRYPKEYTVVFCLIENAIHSDNTPKIESYCEYLFNQVSAIRVMSHLSPEGPEALVPYNRDRLAAFARAWLELQLNDHSALSLKANENKPEYSFFLTETNSYSGKDRKTLERIYSLINKNRLAQAVETADAALSSADDSRPFLLHKAWAQLRFGNVQMSLATLQTAMLEGLHNRDVFHMIGTVMGRDGMYARGEWFLRRAKTKSPGDLPVGLSLVENRLLAGDQLGAATYGQSILDRHPWILIETVLRDSAADLANHSMIRFFLAKQLKLQLN